MRLNGALFLFLVAFTSLSCSERETLPYIGEKIVDEATGRMKNYQAPLFALQNQEGKEVRSRDFDGQVKVVDFFFTSCPTICPQMTLNLKRVQEHFESEDRLSIISFSIDERNDTPERLKKYARNYGMDLNMWSLLTGSQEVTHELAKDFKVMAFNDGMGEDINLIHDGTFVLLDGQDYVRGYYNGLEDKEVSRLVRDIQTLLK